MMNDIGKTDNAVRAHINSKWLPIVRMHTNLFNNAVDAQM